MIIPVKIRKRILTCKKRVVAGNVETYTVQFTFDEEWESFDKRVIFAFESLESPETPTRTVECVLEGNEINIPWEVIDSVGVLYITVKGVKYIEGQNNPEILLTKLMDSPIGVDPHGLSDGDPAVDPDETIVDYLIRRINEIEVAGAHIVDYVYDDSIGTYTTEEAVQDIYDLYTQGAVIMARCSGGGPLDYKILHLLTASTDMLGFFGCNYTTLYYLVADDIFCYPYTFDVRERFTQITAQLANKLNIFQGAANAGKSLIINNAGNAVPGYPKVDPFGINIVKNVSDINRSGTGNAYYVTDKVTPDFPTPQETIDFALPGNYKILLEDGVLVYIKNLSEEYFVKYEEAPNHSLQIVYTEAEYYEAYLWNRVSNTWVLQGSGSNSNQWKDFFSFTYIYNPAFWYINADIKYLWTNGTLTTRMSYTDSKTQNNRLLPTSYTVFVFDKERNFITDAKFDIRNWLKIDNDLLFDSEGNLSLRYANSVSDNNHPASGMFVFTTFADLIALLVETVPGDSDQKLMTQKAITDVDVATNERIDLYDNTFTFIVQKDPVSGKYPNIAHYLMDYYSEATQSFSRKIRYIYLGDPSAVVDEPSVLGDPPYRHLVGTAYFASMTMIIEEGHKEIAVSSVGIFENLSEHSAVTGMGESHYEITDGQVVDDIFEIYNMGLSSENVVQSTGSSNFNVMSQAATTAALANITRQVNSLALRRKTIDLSVSTVADRISPASIIASTGTGVYEVLEAGTLYADDWEDTTAKRNQKISVAKGAFIDVGPDNCTILGVDGYIYTVYNSNNPARHNWLNHDWLLSESDAEDNFYTKAEIDDMIGDVQLSINNLSEVIGS